jgi:hypothetical protein
MSFRSSGDSKSSVRHRQIKTPYGLNHPTHFLFPLNRPRAKKCVLTAGLADHVWEIDILVALIYLSAVSFPSMKRFLRWLFN